MKAIFALMGASILMIVVGLVLILNQPEPEPAEPARDIGMIPAPAERDSEIPQIKVDAEPGSDAWCEQMMNVPNADWSREDSQTFADQCIYD